MTPGQPGHPFPRKLMTICNGQGRDSVWQTTISESPEPFARPVTSVTPSAMIISISNSGNMSLGALSGKACCPPVGRGWGRVHVSDEAAQRFLTWRLPWRGREKPRRGFLSQTGRRKSPKLFTLVTTLRWENGLRATGAKVWPHTCMPLQGPLLPRKPYSAPSVHPWSKNTSKIRSEVSK